MSYLIFFMAEVFGLLFMLATWKGVFGLMPSFLAVVIMMALSFHVLARNPKPDGTSIRMASFSAMLWYCSVLCGKLMLENRGWAISLGAFVMMAITATIAAFASYSVLQRPLDYDVDEAQ